MSIKHYSKILLQIIIIIVFCAYGRSQTTVEVSHMSKSVSLGTSFSLNIIIQNVTNLHAASVTVKFSKTLIRYTGSTQGGFLGSNGDNVLYFSTPTPGPNSDSVKVDEAILGVGAVTGSGILFTVNFVSLQQHGTTPIQQINVDLRDQDNALIPSTIVNGQVIVTAPVFMVAPSSLSFGDVVVGANKQDSVTITNTGNMMLHVSSVVSENSQFHVVSSVDSIGASASKEYYIAFTPTSTGVQTSNIIVTHDAVSSPDTVVVHGTGIQAQFTVAPVIINFGDVLVGAMKEDSVNVTNNGTAILHVTTISSDNVHFTSQQSNCTVAPLESQKIYFRFTPATSGSKEGAIIFTHDAQGSPDTVAVTGTGIEPLFSVLPTGIDFGNVVVDSNKLDSVTVTNIGTAMLHISSVVSGNVLFSAFPITDSIAPSATKKFRIQFSPISGGLQSTAIIFSHDAPGSTDTVNVYGTGVYIGSISGLKFEDSNGNGVLDSGEPGLQNWTIVLGGTRVESTLTNSLGMYSFTDLHPGNYTVSEVQQTGWVLITLPPSQVTLGTNQTVGDINFGNFHFGSIHGKKYNDLNGNGVGDSGEPGLSNWTILLDKDSNGTVDAITETDNFGNYSFTQLGAGIYRVREVLSPGWVQITNNPTDVVVSSGSIFSNMDFGNFKTGFVSGLKFNDLNGDGIKGQGEPGLEGWTIQATKDSTIKEVVTGSDGSYSFQFNNLDVGQWIVNEIHQANWTQTFPLLGSYAIQIQSGIDTLNVNFGNTMAASISGQKYNDIQGDSAVSGDHGLNGWVIKLYKNNTLEARKLTTGNGNYSFIGLSPGTYVVQESLQTNWIQTYPKAGAGIVSPISEFNAGAHAYQLEIQSGSVYTQKDFGNFELGIISGTVFEEMDGDSLIENEATEYPLSNWIVRLKKNGIHIDSVISGSDGGFNFTGLMAGTYEVSQTAPSNYYQTIPTEPQYILTVSSGSDLAGNYFGCFQYGDIKGFVYQDRDKDAMFDTNLDNYLERVKLILSGSHTEPETAITGPDGQFIFYQIPSDVYTLRMLPDSQWSQTFPRNGASHIIQMFSGFDTSELIFGSFFRADSMKFRTFSIKDFNKVATTKNKKGYCKKPTVGNVRDSIVVKRGFGWENPADSGYLRVGIKRSDSSSYYGWLFHRWLKYKQINVKSYIFDMRSELIVRPYRKTPYYKRPPNYLMMTGEHTAEAKFSKYGNHLSTELIGLKANVAASDLNITPSGFGDLVYNSVGGGDTVVHNMTIRQIIALTDTALTMGRLVLAPHDTLFRYSRQFLWMLDTVVCRLNNSFYRNDTRLDTVSTKPIIVKGTYPLYSVPYLIRDMARSVPLTRFDLIASDHEQPARFFLEQNYPNPFNPSTTIEFELPEQALITLKIYNVLGQEVATILDQAQMDAGYQEVDFNAGSFASGVYFYRLEAVGIQGIGEQLHFTSVKKMILMR